MYFASDARGEFRCGAMVYGHGDCPTQQASEKRDDPFWRVFAPQQHRVAFTDSAKFQPARRVLRDEIYQRLHVRSRMEIVRHSGIEVRRPPARTRTILFDTIYRLWGTYTKQWSSAAESAASLARSACGNWAFRRSYWKRPHAPAA